MMPLRFLFTPLLLAFLAIPSLAIGQDVGPLNINIAEDLFSSQRVFQLIILLTVLSLAPSILMMVTSFTRIIVVFSFLRSAMGLQSTPPNTVMVSLALFLTTFIMAPTFEEAYQKGMGPYLEGTITEEQAFKESTAPFKGFMLRNVHDTDLDLFINLLPEEERNAVTQVEEEGRTITQNVPLRALIPAFMISELRRAFEIGFLLFLPFLVIDLTIASILMSMGMMMLPPVIVSLPFKIIFFVLVDGWRLLTSSLVESFQY